MAAKRCQMRREDNEDVSSDEYFYEHLIYFLKPNLYKIDFSYLVWCPIVFVFLSFTLL